MANFRQTVVQTAAMFLAVASVSRLHWHCTTIRSSFLLHCFQRRLNILYNFSMIILLVEANKYDLKRPQKAGNLPFIGNKTCCRLGKLWGLAKYYEVLVHCMEQIGWVGDGCNSSPPPQLFQKPTLLFVHHKYYNIQTFYEKNFHPNYTLSLYWLSDSAIPILYTLNLEKSLYETQNYQQQIPERKFITHDLNEARISQVFFWQKKQGCCMISPSTKLDFLK